MDKNVLNTYTGILLNHKKIEIMSFAATQMDLETTILSQKKKKILHNITYMQNLKKMFQFTFASCNDLDLEITESLCFHNIYLGI